MMDYIFKEWQEKLSKFESSVQKDLEEIRQCKAEMQQMNLEAAGRRKGQYICDNERLILSAPEIIIGYVDEGGKLFEGMGSNVVIRGTQVDVQGAGKSGQVAVRAASISQIAEDPGNDGQERVVHPISQVVSQARNITIQSNDAEGYFSDYPHTTAGSGVRIHADEHLDISATQSSKHRKERLEALLGELKSRNGYLQKQAMSHKQAFSTMVAFMEQLLTKKSLLTVDNELIRASYQEVDNLNEQIDHLALSLAGEVRAYADVLSLLAETGRQLKCVNKEKDGIIEGDDFKQASTGASVNIAGEAIRLTSVDGDNNLRDNEGAGVKILANEVTVASVEHDGSLKQEGKLSINTKTVQISTTNNTDKEYDDEGNLTTAAHAAEGDVIVRSKNITLESMDYEVADKQMKEKQLAADGKISVRAKTVEVSTENSANIEVGEDGQLTKANYTAEGDIVVRSKTLTVESTDRDLENGETKEKALTKDSKITVRAEKMDLSATDTEGKSTGSIQINAKAVGVKAMDVEKEKRTDDKLAAGSTMVLVAEKMFVGAKSKDVKSKKLQAQSEEIGLFADNTLEAQQGDGKAVVQLDGGNTNVGGSKTAVYGDTTINAKAEIKGELKAPKATIDNIEAKSSFKSPNMSDGMAVPAAGGAGSLSTKLKAEEAPKE